MHVCSCVSCVSAPVTTLSHSKCDCNNFFNVWRARPPHYSTLAIHLANVHIFATNLLRIHRVCGTYNMVPTFNKSVRVANIYACVICHAQCPGNTHSLTCNSTRIIILPNGDITETQSIQFKLNSIKLSNLMLLWNYVNPAIANGMRLIHFHSFIHSAMRLIIK